MATIFRLGRSALLINQALLKHELKKPTGLAASSSLLSIRPVSLQSQSCPPESTLSHDERNMKLGRPQSPHLTIYAPQMTSMLSISHRITGMAMAGYTIAFGLGALVLPDTIPHYIDTLASWQIGAAPLFIAKMILVYPLTYHFWNGIRHLLWDMGKFFTIKEVYTTGYIMLALAGVSSIVVAAL